jgi:tetratricopeptide (TPR) repeat protein
MPARRLVLAVILATAALAQDDPAVSIPTLIKDGDASYLKRDYETAYQTFLRAWDAAQQTAADNQLRYDVLKRLTNVRSAVGDFTSADQWLQQAVAWREAARGKQDPRIADDLLLSVGFYRNLKDYDRALDMMRRVQALHTSIYGAANPIFADDFSRMAQIYAEQKNNAQAISMYRIALDVRTRLSGPLDPTLVPELDRLGELYTAERTYDQAEEVYRHDLVIRETIYGKVHADLIATVDGLAYSLFGQKKYDDAEPVYRRLLDLWIFSVGKDHPMVAMTLDKTALFYADQKKYAEAKDALDRSSAIRARFHAFGVAHQATEAFTEGNQSAARAFYLRALTIVDDPNPLNDDLRKQFSEILKTLDQPLPKKSATPTQKKSPGQFERD